MSSFLRHSITLLLLFAIHFIAIGQNYFRVIGGIPHLPVIEPSSISAPEVGMLIYSQNENSPLLYSGSEWISLCSSKLNMAGYPYFVVKNGIPLLPIVNAIPAGTFSAGTMAYSLTDHATIVHTGNSWSLLHDLIASSGLSLKSGVSSGTNVETLQIPVLNAPPSGPSYQAGAIYVNAINKGLEFYTGTAWKTLNCGIVITTLPTSSADGYTALSGGNILSTGTSLILRYGTVWSPAINPDTTLTSKTTHDTSTGYHGIFNDSIKDLLPNTTYFVRAYAVNSEEIAYGDNVKFTTPVALATIITLPIDSISNIRAVSGGKITADGGGPITRRGIIWSSLSDPLNDSSNIITNDGSGVGIFPSTLMHILGNTTYYIRAYAVNSAGTAYGNLIIATTPPPSVPALNSTMIFNDVTNTTASISALIINNGGAIVTDKGVCISTDDLHYTFISSNYSMPSDIGSYMASISGLAQGTKYYIKAYATNSVGTGYSAKTSFITASLPSLITDSLSNLSGQTAISGGEITDIGNSRITVRGVCWSTSHNPDISLATKTTESVVEDGVESFVASLSGLEAGKTYYIRAYATNRAGTGYGNEIEYHMPDSAKVSTLTASSFTFTSAKSGGNVTSDGGNPVTQRGVCWSTNPMPTTGSSLTSDGDSLGIFTSHLTGLKVNTTYYYRAYATNAIGTSYGDQKTFIIHPEAPVVETSPVSNIASMTASGGGKITSDGGYTVTKRGIIYSTNVEPLDDTTHVVTLDGTGSGTFTSSLQNLLGNTIYYVRAYAENSYARVYGDIVHFKTAAPVLASVTAPVFPVDELTDTTAIGHFSIINNGGATITSRGICFSLDGVQYTYIQSSNPNITDIGDFLSLLKPLTAATTYYAKAYAINSAGISYSNEITFKTAIHKTPQNPYTTVPGVTTAKPEILTGTSISVGGNILSAGGDTLTTRGICWSLTRTPVASMLPKIEETINKDQLGAFSGTVSGLQPNTKYYIRAYAINSYGIGYGNLDSITTPTPPTVLTLLTTGITSNKAIGAGNVTNDGGAPVQSRGLCWGTTRNIDISGAHIASGSGTGIFNGTISGLAGTTKYYIRAYAMNVAGISYGAIDSLKTLAPQYPTVTTASVDNVKDSSAVITGTVVDDGGALVNERGFCWNTTGLPVIYDNHLAEGTGTGNFSLMIKNLIPETKYYVRAYAVNSVGIVYGAPLEFTTFTKPTITTTTPYAITGTRALSGGNITSDGASIVTTSGICWNTTGNPTVSDQRTTSGVGIGSFIHSITNLLANTTYYVRAYATNSAGTSYGQVESFTTGNPVVPSLQISSTTAAQDGTSASIDVTLLDNGGALMTMGGIVWSKVSGFRPDTVMVNKKVDAFTNSFTSVISNLKPGETYYFRGIAVNSAGTGYSSNESSVTMPDYPTVTTSAINPASITSVSATGGGNVTSTGGSPVTESGLCWNDSPFPTVADQHALNGTGSGIFTTSLQNLMGSTTYYVRAYAKNAVGIAYGSPVVFTTLAPVLATISTITPTATSSTSGKSGGDITSNGGAYVTTRGIVWSTNEFFIADTVVANRTANTGYYTGQFDAEMTNLAQNTVYYVRAYVTNSVGTAYGELKSFRTPQLPTITTAYATANGPTKGTSGGDITNDGSSPILSRGIVWSNKIDFDPSDPLVNKTSDGAGSGTFVSLLANLKGNTIYYVRAYASNVAGISYGNQLSFITDPATLATVTTNSAGSITGTTAVSGGNISDDGGETVTTRGLVWSTAATFRPDTVVANKLFMTGQGNGSFNMTISGLKMGTTYYVRAFAKNSIGTAYGNVVSFKTLTIPSVSTLAVTPSADGYGGSGGGKITSDGGSSISNQGVCWSLTPNPTVGLYTKTSHDTGTDTTFTSTLSTLLPNTKYYVRAYAVNNQGIAYGNEVSFTTRPALPILTTNVVTITSKSAVTTGGNITSGGGIPVLTRGMVWSTQKDFNPDTVIVNRITNGSGDGNFISVINNLKMSIAYYVRAYATNSVGTAYGNQVTFTIFPTAPVLDTDQITALPSNIASSGGAITSDGGADVTLKGLCWATHTNPTIDDFRTYDGSGTSPFSSMMSNLQPNTIYYVRAYAINKIGVGYGVEKTILTNGLPTLLATTPVTNIIATTATSGGQITDNGRAPIIVHGVCWSTLTNPTVDLASKTTDTLITNIGSFISNMKGLTPNTYYFVRAYATNAVGTGYGSQVTFKTLPVMLPTLTTIHPSPVDSTNASSGGIITNDGGMPVTERGICWDTKPYPVSTLSTKLTDPGVGTGTYTATLRGLLPGTKYYVRAYAVNTKGVAYGNMDSLKTLPVKAHLTTVLVDSVTMVSARLKASIIYNGGDSIATRGFCINTTGNPTIANDTIQTGIGSGSFNAILQNLHEGPTYYVRAFAINSAGVAYSPTVSSFRICPLSFNINHYEGLNGAPATKTVTYHSVSSTLSGKAVCWLKQNLGADTIPSAATDATIRTSGWYWQFGNIQGYEYNTSRNPLTWANVVAPDTIWTGTNDPCSMLLGQGWRIPTKTEWTNVVGAPHNWTNYNSAYNSELKLNTAGFLSNGSLVYRGSIGEYWSSTQQTSTIGYNLGYDAGTCQVQANYKLTYGFSLRCLRDTIKLGAPSASKVKFSNMTNHSVDLWAGVSPDGGSPVSAKGFVWNTTGNPTLSDNVVAQGSGVGPMSTTLSGLTEGPTYYVRAYATNSSGTAYSTLTTSFKICPPVFSVIHIEGLNGAPISKTVQYHSVSSELSGKAVCWLTQNLGADTIPSTVNDATNQAAGWYWQFSKTQGYINNGSLRTPSTTWTSVSDTTSRWLPSSDPCSLLLGGGWRIPTSSEYSNVIANGGIPFTSDLKLHYAGYLNYSDGSLAYKGSYGIYWSSTSNSPTIASYLQFGVNGVNAIYNSYKWHGFSLRCLRDTLSLSVPGVGKVILSDMTDSSIKLTAGASPDGGSAVTDRGFCWSTTNTSPTTSDNVIHTGSGLGTFSDLLGSLQQGVTYYVRAFATNSKGTGYSYVSTPFKICPPSFTIQHIAGLDGSPVTKKITYHSTSSPLSGKMVCWITQNLGADTLATASTDATERASGWFWQFNRLQGYKHDGTTRTPSTSWISIYESGDWVPANDPCSRLLGSGWRLPSSTELTNVYNNGGFSYTSDLKLHYGGYLNYPDGSLIGRGVYGNLWSSSADGSLQNGTYVYYNGGGTARYSSYKPYGFNVRCLRDSVVTTAPSVKPVTVNMSTFTSTEADLMSGVGSDGGSAITARGICWNTTGEPTVADHVIYDTNASTGLFSVHITGLTEGTTYYVRAFATNAIGVGYSVGSGFNAIMTGLCPDTFRIKHIAGINGAPVSKTVTYHALGSYASGAAKCWIKQNLGADTLANSVTDSREKAAGWYFQFNHMLGYKHDGTSRNPIAWYGGFNEASDWLQINDPCYNMLGADWRIPTYTELINVNKTPALWTTYNDAFASDLRLHSAGYLVYNSGDLGGRGVQGNYWSSTNTNNTGGYCLYFTGGVSALSAADKAYGFSVRCLRDGIVKMPPTLSNVAVPDSTVNSNSAKIYASVVLSGGAAVTEKGFVWNLTGNPTITNNKIINNTTDSVFSNTITGMNQSDTYYIRAYARNALGLSYSPTVTLFKLCPKTFNIIHNMNDFGAPESKNVTYHSTSLTWSGKAACWLTQNLGADNAADSLKNVTNQAAGWYWQFNRPQAYTFSGTTISPTTPWVASINENADWQASNDPCRLLLSNGWRIPTATEWNNALVNGKLNNTNPLTTPLKLHYSGQIVNSTPSDRKNYGIFWSSTQTATNVGAALQLTASGSAAAMTAFYKSERGLSLRCLRDSFAILPPSVGSATLIRFSDSTVTARATITLDGGSPVTARGFVWNTTGNPTLSNGHLLSGSGLGTFTDSIQGLREGYTYYVRAYATNNSGTGYSPTSTDFKVCKPVKITHIAGFNGAPESKVVKYNTVSSRFSGKLMCWIIQNLGADTVANAVNDTREKAAGWYWQFNRLQGFKNDGTTLTPTPTSWNPWIGGISENTSWQAINDPCNRQMGMGWRLPTSTEWTNADGAPQNWNTAADAFASPLKLHMAGNLAYNTGALQSRGTYGHFWSSDQYPDVSYGYFMYIYNGYSGVTYTYKSLAISARCLRDSIVLSAPMVSNVQMPDSTIYSTSAKAFAFVTSDGGSTITQRGIVWNTTGNPTTSNNVIATGSGLGNIAETLTGLSEGPTYYVRAFATNAQGTTYSPAVFTFKICPSNFSVIHTAGLNGAPETKTITYHSVNTNISGKSMCWLTQNLGASQLATSVSDTSMAAGGWYWQFNRLQGYKHNGTTRTPSNAWTSWITSISDNSDWQAINDPCNRLLGLGWRIPTSTEWTNADAPPQNWTTATDAFNSVLKLHIAGWLAWDSGTLLGRGSSNGDYWSSTQYPDISYGYFHNITPGNSSVTYANKAHGFSIRCIRDTISITKPIVSNVTVPTATMTSNSAIGNATVASDGGAALSERGIVWNTTGNPTISNNKVVTGTGLGSITETMATLQEGPTYYVRAFATNSKGTSYSPDVTSFKICPTSFSVIHTAGLNGAPESKTITYHSISTNISGAAMCWLTQNLGAIQQPSSVSDTSLAAGGWYWQFNRLQGYRHNGTTRTPSNAWTSWITSISENSDWKASNDPCNRLLGLGWRIPTSTEWTNADAPPQNWTTAADAFSSVLKLHLAGWLAWDSGSLLGRGGSNGDYWSSTQYPDVSYGYFHNITPGSSGVTYANKAHGFSIRCIRDTLVLNIPSVSNVTVPTSSMTANSADGFATVSSDGGSTATQRGFCWNTTGNPTTSDHVVPLGSGTGDFTGTLPSLTEGPTYYVRAFATNIKGTGYSPDVTSFKICPTSFSVIHTEGLNGAPESKTITYHSISSNISGAAMCWLTQNLGASQQPTAVNDATEASGGWFWQFNRLQGYKHDGTTRTPSNAWTSWITSISDNSDWKAINDPCNRLLGLGWRIPTSTEWNNADAPPQNWTTAADAFNSVLKLHMAGWLAWDSGNLGARGASNGDYWSSTQYPDISYGYFHNITSGSSGVTYANKAHGFSIRCIRDTISVSRPVVSNVTVPTTTMSANSAVGNATVATDGGASISERGIVWNTTGTPTLSDNKVATGSGLGSITETMATLQEGPTYYVRAFATNSKGTSYSPDVTSFKICPTSFSVIHTAGLNGAPESKIINYHSISSNISGAAMCWLTQNLGASQQPTAVNDATEASGGWFWQFNRLQGYKHDGTTRTPSNAWTSWITSISDNSNWIPANDPCNILLGLGWRIPTATEWTNADAPPQNWTTATDAFNSVLKLHLAGWLAWDSGNLGARGASSGNYWSSTQYGDVSYGYFHQITPTGSGVTYAYKAHGFSIRCIRDTLVLNKPSVSDVTIPTSSMTTNTADGSATVSSDGGAPVTQRGFCWNTTGNPTASDHVVPLGSGIGDFTGTVSTLTEGPTYYVRAFAKNIKGIGYSPNVTSFKICPTSFSVIHTEGLNGAPESKTITYHSISSNISGAAMCWLTQNLGATQQPTSVSDTSLTAGGWYWQFNRLQGYKYCGTTRTPSNAWTSWITSISDNSDWKAINDPCNRLLGLGWRIPTSTEWTNADAPPQNWTSAADAFNSVLKLHLAGWLAWDSGNLGARGASSGNYWSSTQYGDVSYGYFHQITPTGSGVTYAYKAHGFSIRCIRDTISVSRPVVSNVTVPTTTMSANSAVGNATVATDGGATISERGIVWNTTGNPSISDNKVATGSGLGSISETMATLKQGPTYYVRAFATNPKGTSYSPDVTSFKICPTTFSVIHTAGLNGAPESKTITYHSISSNISGAAMCWLTQNLGADQQPTAVTDATEASGGWFWQFNRLQGYKHDGTTRTPSNAWTSWVTSISDNNNWIPANDPCNTLLGLGWRIPTATEWTNADAPPQNWTTSTDAFNSVLKLHQAGWLAWDSGNLGARGTSYGNYWSSTQYPDVSYGYFHQIVSNGSSVTYAYKSHGFSIRCIRDTIVVTKPSVSNLTVPTSTMTANAAVGNATIATDGGATIQQRGICWNTTGNPTTSDNTTIISGTLGDISGTLSSLSQGPTYYARAFATNSQGTTYSPDVTSFKICPTSFSVIHTEGLNGAPVTKTVTYHSISSNISGAALCWLTQNLGADNQPSATNDVSESAAGWYWQFNRLQGYKHDGTTRTPANAWTPWITSISDNSNWSASNDPCNKLLGSGWRIPTSAEWNNADAPPQNWTTVADGFASVLKLHMGGDLYYANGNIENKGSYAFYWTSTQYPDVSYGYLMHLYNGYSGVTYTYKSVGCNVRCVRDLITVTQPGVSAPIVPATSIGATSAAVSATVTPDGGDNVSARGFCWNTTGNPSTSDLVYNGGTGTGTMSTTISGLTMGTTYYIRTFATNSAGTAYSDVVSFKVCPTSFAISHVAGTNGAPVTKTVTYSSISSTMSGNAKCWLTQNLGADNQPSSVTDASEAAAGWYWEFNRLQGYKHDGTTRTPSSGWIGVSENSDWSAANDPCLAMLGTGWRIPTSTEWSNADAPPQNWTTANDGFASILKLHEGGDLNYGSGNIENRGAYAFYWTSSQYPDVSYGYLMHLYNGYSGVTYTYKSVGCSVRCIKD